MEKEMEKENCEAAGKQIVVYQKALQQFSNILASCYTEYDTDNDEVKKIRSQIVNNTLLYCELHFRASKEFITGLREVMRSYMDLTPDEFADCIEEVAEEAAHFKDQAQLVQDLHINLHSDCKTLIEDADTAVRQLKLQADDDQNIATEQIAISKRREKKEDRATLAGATLAAVSIVAAIPTGGASVLGLIPAVGAALYSSRQEHKKDKASSRSVAATESAENAILAAKQIAGPMVRCVEQFTQAISQATLFFTTVNDQLQQFKHSADSAVGKKLQEIQGKIRLHCIKLKAPARNLVYLCDGFMQVADGVDAELMRICSKEGKHESYIQQWVEKHEQNLKLVETLEYRKGDHKTRWELIERWCPSVRSGSASVWVEVVMDNRNGAGLLQQEIQVQEMLQLARTWSEEMTKTSTSENSTNLEVNIDGKLSVVGIGGKSALNLKNATSAAEKTSQTANKQIQLMLGKKVVLQADAGKACRYRIILRVQRGCFTDFNVEAMSMNVPGRKSIDKRKEDLDIVEALQPLLDHF